jgi:hypothetical protein
VNQGTRPLGSSFDVKNRGRRRCCVRLALTTPRLLDLSVTSVPVYCRADFLRLLLQQQDRDSATNAAAIQTWATAPGSRLPPLDEPVKRFLKFGGVYAEDFLDRSLGAERHGEQWSWAGRAFGDRNGAQQ